MARRRQKADLAGLGILLIVGCVVVGLSKLFDSLGGAGLLLGCVVAISLFVWYRRAKYKARVAYLRAKYGNEEIVQKILKRNFWRGQTAAQLADSLGNPADIDHKVMATRSRQVWKYNQRGVNRYGLRITVDDGIVNGWDQK